MDVLCDMFQHISWLIDEFYKQLMSCPEFSWFKDFNGVRVKGLVKDTTMFSPTHVLLVYEGVEGITIYQSWPISGEQWSKDTTASMWTDHMSWKENKSPIPLVPLSSAFWLYG